MADPDADKYDRAKAALARMPARTRRIFVANRVEGLSYAEIAEREGLFHWQVRPGTVRALPDIPRPILQGAPKRIARHML